MKIKIYSTSKCGVCHAEKEFLKEHKIEFEDLDVFIDKEAQAEMIEKTGQYSVPVTDIDGKIIIGFNKEELKRILNI
jgi:glutaredoxin-like YruB-family protein